MDNYRIHPFLVMMLLPILLGGLFSGLFVASWFELFWGDGDEERVQFLCAVEVFAGPLVVGAIQATRGKQIGARLLRFGSLLFIIFPPIWRELRHLETFPPYIDYLTRKME